VNDKINKQIFAGIRFSYISVNNAKKILFLILAIIAKIPIHLKVRVGRGNLRLAIGRGVLECLVNNYDTDASQYRYLTLIEYHSARGGHGPLVKLN